MWGRGVGVVAVIAASATPAAPTATTPVPLISGRRSPGGVVVITMPHLGGVPVAVPRGVAVGATVVVAVAGR